MRKLRLAHRGKGEPLSHVITAHRQFRSAVPENIGDGFLYEFNPVFRSVRDEARARGVKFTHQDYCNYFAYPLMCIDDVINARRIPYRRNFPWLEILAKRDFNLDDLKKGELQYNYLFHESAHLIAHDIFFGRKSLARVPKNASTLLAIMVGEAFANTVECLASAFAEGEIGSYFLDANCHFRASEREVKILRAALRRYGAETTARVLMGAFLYSNYLVERLTGAELSRVRKFAGLPADAPVGALAKIGLQLNEKFRSVTTPLHLRKSGFGANLPRLFAVDPLRLLLSSSALRKGAERLAVIAARDTRRT